MAENPSMRHIANRQNSIYDNNGLGIDLVEDYSLSPRGQTGGVLPNDGMPNPADTVPNEGMDGTIDALDTDSDDDGLEDGPEVNNHGTDPTKADTVEGGATDAEEIERGTDPLNAGDDSLERPGASEAECSCKAAGDGRGSGGLGLAGGGAGRGAVAASTRALKKAKLRRRGRRRTERVGNECGARPSPRLSQNWTIGRRYS